MYTCTIDTPLGTVRAAAADEALTGLWFIGQKYFPVDFAAWTEAPERPAFAALRSWLAAYFNGKKPALTVPLAPKGTAFQQAVWKLLLEIPYGKTATYGGLAAILKKPGAGQAVGGAVGHNPISLIIPCHRVLGADGGLSGYAGGLEKKRALLELEGRKAG
ncbi:MAG: methylated-DNA--[protein]-cysteine S-methyltransferase [Spirochaetaceae bacterium]|jgi:methylated-DNA-[protein]-cysteine S-methyltransferase|nr:methylated-DNA--[protein]-cysteine S-methyltransferase [Spirochaetaceae bacterium]